MKRISLVKLRFLLVLFLFTLNALYLSAVIIPLFFNNAKHRNALSEASGLSVAHANLRIRLTQTKNALSETAAMIEAGIRRLAAGVPLHQTQKKLFELATSSGLHLQKLKYEKPLPLIHSDTEEEADALMHLGVQLSLAGKWRDYLLFRERIATSFHKIQILEERVETQASRPEPRMNLKFRMFRQKHVLQ